jgi:hypothetical protein
MLIVSKHKDFYDGVAGSMGIDKTIVFNREMLVFEKDEDLPKIFKGSWRDNNAFHNINLYDVKSNKYGKISTFIVGFCGKLYVGWKLYNKSDNRYGYDFPIEISYDFDLVKNNLNHRRWNNSNFVDDYNYIVNYDPIELFRKYNTPIFIIDWDYQRVSVVGYGNNKVVFIVNPILNEYVFYKIFDSFTAFQEIQMFISGVLGTNQKNIVEIDDKHKIVQHGFDKWSFRKEPSEKKKKIKNDG